jgi:hypothetical protein
MKGRIATLALAVLAIAPALVSARPLMYPPGPSLWDSVMRFFGG